MATIFSSVASANASAERVSSAMRRADASFSFLSFFSVRLPKNQKKDPYDRAKDWQDPSAISALPTFYIFRHDFSPPLC
jgi:hypothetical protein